MTALSESHIPTMAAPATPRLGAARRSRAKRLLRTLADKRNILVTTHDYPDPDALASAMGLCRLLRKKLPDVTVTLSAKNFIASGPNAAFAQQVLAEATPWDEAALSGFDAIVLLDAQPAFRNCPLPPGISPTAVIDHHLARGRRPVCPFVDIRTEVGATASIVYTYFHELGEQLEPAVAAALLFAIETDLAGAAGHPGELDTAAIASLTLWADPRRLYAMRYVDLPQKYYAAYASALGSAVFWPGAMIAHIGTPVSPETPAAIADFLLRFDQVQWVLVTAVGNGELLLSLRTATDKASAGDVMRRLLKNIGEGGGHRTKAGGAVTLANGGPAEQDRLRKILRRRLLRALRIRSTRPQRLVPRAE